MNNNIFQFYNQYELKKFNISQNIQSKYNDLKWDPKEENFVKEKIQILEDLPSQSGKNKKLIKIEDVQIGIDQRQQVQVISQANISHIQEEVTLPDFAQCFKLSLKVYNWDVLSTLIEEQMNQNLPKLKQLTLKQSSDQKLYIKQIGKTLFTLIHKFLEKQNHFCVYLEWFGFKVQFVFQQNKENGQIEGDLNLNYINDQNEYNLQKLNVLLLEFKKCFSSVKIDFQRFLALDSFEFGNLLSIILKNSRKQIENFQIYLNEALNLNGEEVLDSFEINKEGTSFKLEKLKHFRLGLANDRQWQQQFPYFTISQMNQFCIQFIDMIPKSIEYAQIFFGNFIMMAKLDSLFVGATIPQIFPEVKVDAELRKLTEPQEGEPLQREEFVDYYTQGQMLLSKVIGFYPQQLELIVHFMMKEFGNHISKININMLEQEFLRENQHLLSDFFQKINQVKHRFKDIRVQLDRYLVKDQETLENIREFSKISHSCDQFVIQIQDKQYDFFIQKSTNQQNQQNSQLNLDFILEFTSGTQKKAQGLREILSILEEQSAEKLLVRNFKGSNDKYICNQVSGLQLWTLFQELKASKFKLSNFIFELYQGENINGELFADFYEMIKKKGESLENLTFHLQKCKNLYKEGFPKLKKSFYKLENLKSLSLVFHSINHFNGSYFQDLLAVLSQKCVQIQTLKIGYTKNIKFREVQKSLNEITKNFQDLETYDLHLPRLEYSQGDSSQLAEFYSGLLSHQKIKKVSLIVKGSVQILDQNDLKIVFYSKIKKEEYELHKIPILEMVKMMKQKRGEVNKLELFLCSFYGIFNYYQQKSEDWKIPYEELQPFLYYNVIEVGKIVQDMIESITNIQQNIPNFKADIDSDHLQYGPFSSLDIIRKQLFHDNIQHLSILLRSRFRFIYDKKESLLFLRYSGGYLGYQQQDQSKSENQFLQQFSIQYSQNIKNLVIQQENLYQSYLDLKYLFGSEEDNFKSIKFYQNLEYYHVFLNSIKFQNYWHHQEVHRYNEQQQWISDSLLKNIHAKHVNFTIQSQYDLEDCYQSPYTKNLYLFRFLRKEKLKIEERIIQEITSVNQNLHQLDTNGKKDLSFICFSNQEIDFSQSKNIPKMPQNEEENRLLLDKYRQYQKDQNIDYEKQGFFDCMYEHQDKIEPLKSYKNTDLYSFFNPIKKEIQDLEKRFHNSFQYSSQFRYIYKQGQYIKVNPNGMEVDFNEENIPFQ